MRKPCNRHRRSVYATAWRRCPTFSKPVARPPRRSTTYKRYWERRKSREAIHRALDQRPDLQAKAAEIRLAQAERQQARAAFYPNLNVAVDSSAQSLYLLQQTFPWGHSADLNGGARLSLNWTVFDGGARRRRLAQAEAHVRGAEAQVSAARDRIEDQVWTAYANLKTAFRREGPPMITNPRKLAVSFSVLFLTGCSRAPSFDILGSFFPARLVCLAASLLLTVAARSLLLRIGVVLAVPILTYPSMTALFTFALRLTLFR